MNSVIEDDLKYIANTYKRNGVAIIGGSGAVARDINNKKYVDMSSGIGAVSYTHLTLPTNCT